MSTDNPVPLVPGEILNDADRLALSARLDQLRRANAHRPKHFQAPPGLDEVTLAAERARWDAETQALIREQLTILAQLRRTSAGPARKGGKRAKSAPVDLGSMLAKLANM